MICGKQIGHVALRLFPVHYLTEGTLSWGISDIFRLWPDWPIILSDNSKQGLAINTFYKLFLWHLKMRLSDRMWYLKRNETNIMCHYLVKLKVHLQHYCGLIVPFLKATPCPLDLKTCSSIRYFVLTNEFNTVTWAHRCIVRVKYVFLCCLTRC